jgi:hypothetical protein
MKRVLKYHEPIHYEIRVEGELDPCWSGWFEGMVVTAKGGETVLSGPVRDQAALHGLLGKIRDMGLPILSVGRLEGPSGKMSGSESAGAL